MLEGCSVVDLSENAAAGAKNHQIEREIALLVPKEMCSGIFFVCYFYCFVMDSV